MNVILFSQREGRARQFNLAHPFTLGIASIVALGILGTAFMLGMQLGQRGGIAGGDAAEWNQALIDQKAQIADLRRQLQERVDAMAMRLGKLDAHVIRINALGKRLTEMANVDHREFDFDVEPSTGGPMEGEGSSAEIPDLAAMLDTLEEKVELRGAQLSALESVILARKLNEQIRPEGRPIVKGFLSSYFGERQDPFTGHQAFHKGVDFAAAAGTTIIAVAQGVVTWAGKRSGYGSMVEINHGNGFVTRYAHNQKALVAVGQTVERGQPIALVGSTGRSTGPHVHFEVLRNGRQVNPLTFVGRR